MSMQLLGIDSLADQKLSVHDLISIHPLTLPDIQLIFSLAKAMKESPAEYAEGLKGKALALIFDVGSMPCHRLMNRLQQDIVINGLEQKINCPLLHRLHAGGHVAMPGKENHWQREPSFVHLPVQLRPGHFRHLHIEHYATDPGIR